MIKYYRFKLQLLAKINVNLIIITKYLQLEI